MSACPKCRHEWSVLACEECGERWERPDAPLARAEEIAQ